MDYIERFQEALRIKTDWLGDEEARAAEATLTKFQDFLVKSYPAFHKAAERWVLSPYMVLYRWAGRTETEPVLFLAHYDVVPAETAKWTTDPFGAEMKDGYIYGRGALDMKHIVMTLMESAENLCSKGFKPGHDIWFAFGGDEERAGIKGAQEAVKWFSNKGITFSFVLDEGTPVSKDQIKSIDKPLALIGIEEKGYLSLTLTVEQKPGHASQPPENQAAAILGRALLRLEKRHFPWRLTSTIEAFFKHLGLLIPGITGFVMKHARFFGPLFFIAAGTSPATRALLRTTVAMTRLEGSSADNVLPSAVWAVINLRLLPPWTIETATEQIKAFIADNRVKVEVRGPASDPVEATPDQAEQKSPGWKEIKAALGKSFPDIPVLPFLMFATTDSRHYQSQSPYIFRFSPLMLTPEELSRIHGHDERISVENLKHCIEFYAALMEEI